MQTILEKAKSIFKPQPQPAPKPDSGINPAPNRAAASNAELESDFTPHAERVNRPESAAPLTASPASPKELAEETARQVGIMQGDEFANVKLCKAQTPRNSRMLYIEGVPNWSERCICWVKDAESWKPVCPPYDTLKVRYTGMASVDGVMSRSGTG
jgi:hypothetical protein